MVVTGSDVVGGRRCGGVAQGFASHVGLVAFAASSELRVVAEGDWIPKRHRRRPGCVRGLHLRGWHPLADIGYGDYAGHPSLRRTTALLAEAVCESLACAHQAAF